MRGTIAPTGGRREGLPGGNETLRSSEAGFVIDEQAASSIVNLISVATVAYGGWKAYQQYDHRSGIRKLALVYLAEIKLRERTWKTDGIYFAQPQMQEFLDDVVKLRDASRKALKEASNVSKSVDILKEVILRSDKLANKVSSRMRISDELRNQGLPTEMLRVDFSSSEYVSPDSAVISSN